MTDGGGPNVLRSTTVPRDCHRPGCMTIYVMNLENKVAIVTGGARGIGLAIAMRFVAGGACGVIADIDSAAGEAAASALGAAKCRFVATDVGAASDAENTVAEACRLFGRLDILVHNAGIRSEERRVGKE